MGLDERDLETTVAEPAPTHSLIGVAARDVVCPIPAGFTTWSGDRLDATHVRGRLHGPQAGPLVVVAGGISSGRFAADAKDGAKGWWPAVVCDGGPVDTRRVRVLAFDFLPGREQARPVTISPADQARLLVLLLDHLNQPLIEAFVGASYGGCVGLAFAEAFPDRVRRLVAISAPHRAHPAATAWRGIQRRLLQLGQDNGCEAQAIELARELAMTTYRTPEEFDHRFGAGGIPARAGDAYSVCDYLTAQGRGYGEVTTVARWTSLSDSLDRVSVRPEDIRAALTVVGFTSDRLVPIEDLEDLAGRAPRLERFVAAPSLYGHDAFLKEQGLVDAALRIALSSLYARQEIAA
jgi:homoserine O-acetyltransferase